MRYALLPAALMLALLSGAAFAQGAASPGSCADVMLPASVSAKIILGNVADAHPGQLSDITFPTAQDIVELKKFRDAPCRAVSLSYMRTAYPHEAALEDANNRILNDLIAQKISYGVANRQWAQARFDYLRVTGVILEQQIQSAPAPYVPPVVTPDERTRPDQQGVAESQRLLDQNERARQGQLP